MQVLLLTGMSGSGKSVALNVIEDAGYAVVDNLPARFLHDLIVDMQRRGNLRLAVSVDVRGGIESIAELPHILPTLRKSGHTLNILFLTADTPTLVQRYSETRRRHPLSIASDAEGRSRTLEECINEERSLLTALDGIGHRIDTSDLPAATLRNWVRDFVAGEQSGLTLLFQSFAFKQGLPLDADLVFDVRCLPNPHYDVQLRPLTGRDQPVIDYLAAIPAVGQMVDDIASFIERWLPAYKADNRSYLTVAIGCTGGQHRSVYCTEQLASRFRHHDHVLVRHRNLDKQSARRQ